MLADFCAARYSDRMQPQQKSFALNPVPSAPRSLRRWYRPQFSLRMLIIFTSAIAVSFVVLTWTHQKREIESGRYIHNWPQAVNRQYWELERGWPFTYQCALLDDDGRLFTIEPGKLLTRTEAYQWTMRWPAFVADLLAVTLTFATIAFGLTCVISFVRATRRALTTEDQLKPLSSWGGAIVCAGLAMVALLPSYYFFMKHGFQVVEAGVEHGYWREFTLRYTFTAFGAPALLQLSAIAALTAAKGWLLHRPWRILVMQLSVVLMLLVPLLDIAIPPITNRIQHELFSTWFGCSPTIPGL
ncbi:MAG: hypothetical protein K8T91_09610 [Planctomycetes bacterium]|nr:hypothetical protein [Planctomycetota bacterium]